MSFLNHYQTETVFYLVWVTLLMWSVCSNEHISQNRCSLLQVHQPEALKLARVNIFLPWTHKKNLNLKLKASLSQSVNVLIVKHKHTEIYGHNRAYLWFLKQHLPLITPYFITCRLHSLMFCTSYTGKTPSTFCFISFSVCILLTQHPIVILSYLPLI